VHQVRQEVPVLLALPENLDQQEVQEQPAQQETSVPLVPPEVPDPQVKLVPPDLLVPQVNKVL